MSVVKSKRDEGRLLVLTKANELATYTIKICSNEKNFPKHYRWCITSKIVDAAVEISNNANMNLFMSRTVQTTFCESSFKLALASTYALLNMWISYELSVETSRMGIGRSSFTRR